MAFAPFQTGLSDFEQSSINQSLQASQQQAQNVAENQATSEGQSTAETFRGPEFQEELAGSRNLSQNFPSEILNFLAPLSQRFRELEGTRRDNLTDQFRRTGGLKSSSAGRRFTEFERDSGLNEILGQVAGAQSFFGPLAALQQNRLAVAGTPLSRSQSSNRSASSGSSSGTSSGSATGSSTGSSAGSGASAGFGFPPALPPAPSPVPGLTPGQAALAPTGGVGVIGGVRPTGGGQNPFFLGAGGANDFEIGNAQRGDFDFEF